MAKTCDLLKLVLVICLVEFSLTLPLSSEDVFDNSAYDSDVTGYVPIAPLLAPSGYWHQRMYYHPNINERTRAYFVPHKRNSELINSLLGLPKNIDAAGK